MRFEPLRIDSSPSIKKMCSEGPDWPLLSGVIDIHRIFVFSNYVKSGQETYPSIRGYDGLGYYLTTARGGIDGKLRINFAPPPVASS